MKESLYNEPRLSVCHKTDGIYVYDVFLKTMNLNVNEGTVSIFQYRNRFRD